MTFRATFTTLALVGAFFSYLGGCKQLPDDACMGSGEATVAKYEDCKRLCSQGDRDACNRRTAVESGLSQACHKRASTSACKALCHGRKKSQAACDRLRQLLKSN